MLEHCTIATFSYQDTGAHPDLWQKILSNVMKHALFCYGRSVCAHIIIGTCLWLILQYLDHWNISPYLRITAILPWDRSPIIDTCTGYLKALWLCPSSVDRSPCPTIPICNSWFWKKPHGKDISLFAGETILILSRLIYNYAELHRSVRLLHSLIFDHPLNICLS